MKTGRIQISDRKSVKGILNRSRFLLILIIILFLIINYDLFSSEPVFLRTEGYFWKCITITFQLIFIGTLFQWENKKRKIIDILYDGVVTEGILTHSEKIRSSRVYSFYIHMFEYTVDNTVYEVSFKNKSNKTISNYIIYQLSEPSKSIVYDELKSDLKSLINKNIK